MNFIFNSAALKLQTNLIGWTTDVIKIRLVANSVTASQNATSMSGLTGIDVDKTLTTVAPLSDTLLNRTVYGSLDPAPWVSLTGGSTIGALVIYKFVTNDAGSIPIFHLDTNAVFTDGANILVAFPSGTVAYLQQ